MSEDHRRQWTPQSPMLDKENTSNRYQGQKSLKPETVKPALLPKTLLTKTPLRQRQSHQPRTPPSKVLRKHFAQLSVTPHRTKIQSGAVRLYSTEKIKTHVVSKIRSPPRIGYDGTTRTPSKELLRSTACSRSHQVNYKPHAYLHAHERDEQSIATVDLTRHVGRDECCDPVALTLLNDGTEDFAVLIQQDVSPTQHIPKVSSNLKDVMNEEEVATLLRPIPKMPRS